MLNIELKNAEARRVKQLVKADVNMCRQYIRAYSLGKREKAKYTKQLKESEALLAKLEAFGI